MKAQDFHMLGELFAAEIADTLPKQYSERNKRILALEAEGLVERIEGHLGGRMPVVIKGWALTEKGRITYCQACSEIETPHAATIEGGRE